MATCEDRWCACWGPPVCEGSSCCPELGGQCPVSCTLLHCRLKDTIHRDIDTDNNQDTLTQSTIKTHWHINIHWHREQSTHWHWEQHTDTENNQHTPTQRTINTMTLWTINSLIHKHTPTQRTINTHRHREQPTSYCVLFWDCLAMSSVVYAASLPSERHNPSWQSLKTTDHCILSWYGHAISTTVSMASLTILTEQHHGQSWTQSEAEGAITARACQDFELRQGQSCDPKRG